MGPTQIKKNQMNKKIKDAAESGMKIFFYFLYFSLASLFDSRSSDRRISSG